VGTSFVTVKFNLAQCKREVKEFGKLLKDHAELSEKYDILPFFRERDQLCAFLGTFVTDSGPAPELARECSFLGDFVADLFIGHRDHREFLAVEFEDGRKHSIFKPIRGRTTTEWSPRFDHGYSQLIDWFATLDDYKKTDKFRREYGIGHITFTGLLVVGRNSGVSSHDRIRLDWRSDKVIVDSHTITCVTFDDLYQLLQRRLQVFSSVPKSTKK
jgi:hypothetical protein